MTTGDNSGRKQPGKLGLLAPGTLVDGRFTILDFIGEGGSAVVYVAEQKTMHRKVALKVLKPELGSEARRQFVIELRAVGALSDPHTISVYDAGASDDGLLYIAMELLRGRPLSELITQGPIALDRAVRIADQVLDSIEEAHAAGIIHGDLKPENLFISGRPGSDFVKVLDFGIATFFREQSATFDSELSVGTPHYMSPEQVRGHKLDPRTDLYSLAVILYEMVAGKLPFEGVTAAEVGYHKLYKTPPPIRAQNPTAAVPPAFEDFLRRALASEPMLRPRNCAEFRRDLHLALAALPTTGQQVTYAPPPQEPVLRPRHDTRPGVPLPSAPDPGTGKPLPYDRRRVPRERRVRAVCFEHQGAWLRGTVADMSAGGMFVASAVLPPVGSRVAFFFAPAPDQEKWRRLEGLIVRHVPSPTGPGEVRGFGVRFCFGSGTRLPLTVAEALDRAALSDPPVVT